MKILLIENRAPVGFGSNLDVILRATIALNKLGITDIYYYWENINYGEPGENLFDKYIKKQTFDASGELKQFHAIQFAQETLHYDLSFEQNIVLKKWGFFDSEIYRNLKLDAANISGEAGVGIHVRSISATAVPPLDVFFEHADRVLESSLRRYSNDNLVLATDRDSVVGAFNARYGSRLKYNKKVFRCPFYLETEHNEWPELTDKSSFGYDFLLESYLLSTCREIIYVGSNLVVIAAALNPGNFYHMIPSKNVEAWDGGTENIKKLNKQKRILD